MWGTLFHHPFPSVLFRFIPTHVGNTQKAEPRACWKSVHPHACGEHLIRLRGVKAADGSSPRMWGTPQQRPDRLAGLRFIPTHVGNTVVVMFIIINIAVHPHACGEHKGDPVEGTSSAGSSPRMWGTLVYAATSLDILRFIPTHVGNTYPVSGSDSSLPVHPHACGEHYFS